MADAGPPPATAAPYAAPVDTRRWGIGDFFIAAFAWFFIALAVGALLPSIDGSAPVTVRAWSAVAVISLPWIGLAGWPLLATRFKGNGPVADLRLHLTGQGALIGVACGIAGLVIAGMVAALQEQVTGHHITSSAGNAFDSVDQASWVPLLLFALGAGIGAPIAEELAFRGLLFGALEKRGVVVWANVLITGVGFTLFHAEPQRILVLLPIGIALCIARAVTGSTLASILAHMTVNLLPAIGLAVEAFQHGPAGH